MGGINSKLEEYQQDISYLDINRSEIKKFYKIFCKMATEQGQDYVTVKEILSYANVPYTHFAARALCCGFCYVSPTESEENERTILAEYKFDFLTFVYALWNLLTLGPQVYITFIFSVYDADGGGTIDPYEAQVLLKELHGDDFERNLDVIREYNKFAMLVRKNVGLERFQQFAADNPSIFVPARDLQKKLSSCILGPVFWFLHTKKRKKLYGLHYKHVTRVVDKVRIVREQEMEDDWARGGTGNKKYILPKKQQKQVAPTEDEEECDVSPQNMLVLDDGPSDESGSALKTPKKGVSFAADVEGGTSVSSTPCLGTVRSSTSKYFFGTRPNTPSKQISYFLDKFFEKPGEVKVASDCKEALTPYSMIITDRKDRAPVVMTSVQSAIDSTYMVKAKKEQSSAVRLSKRKRKEEIMKTVRDIRSFARGQEFINKHEAKEAEKKPAVRKLTKAQTRLMKTKAKRERLVAVNEVTD